MIFWERTSRTLLLLWVNYLKLGDCKDFIDGPIRIIFVVSLLKNICDPIIPKLEEENLYLNETLTATTISFYFFIS